MGYKYEITAYQPGKWKITWNIKEYGLYPYHSPTSFLDVIAQVQ